MNVENKVMEEIEHKTNKNIHQKTENIYDEYIIKYTSLGIHFVNFFEHAFI